MIKTSDRNARSKLSDPKTGVEGRKTVIQVKVLTRSSRNQIVGKEKGAYRIKLTAPPVDGKANSALKEIIAKRLSVPKRNVGIIAGERSRTKTVRIAGPTLEEVNRLLEGDFSS